jgi:hypothetical protein
MDDVEYVGRASSQKMTSIEQDNKAAQTQYRQDMMATALRRTASKKPPTVELTRERFQEEN